MAVLPINWLPQGRLYNFLWSINNGIFNMTLKAIINDYNIKSYVYLNSYNPFYGHPITAEKRPGIYIYQSRDNIVKSNYVNKHGPKLEILAAEFADIRMGTSRELTAKLSKIKPSIFFPNAANVKLFKTSLNDIPAPVEVDRSKRVIGYFGNVGVRIDFDLLKNIAERFSECQVLLVGPSNYEKYTDIDFSMYKNVTFTGAKRLEELPAYLRYMDCTIMPFLKNELTKSIYPLKINEYLAGGKPVVSSDFSEDLKEFKDLIYLASDYDAFVLGIEHAISECDEELVLKRIEKAEENSWEERVKLFWQLVKNHNEKSR
ncbi:glycosyltransferase [Fulvivirga lutimaris]|uniref:glycosyltransferase n=1 Tax=Fulvivirga lutimaris TaxID=1819566 RepID=UPI001628463D|nr:glycosyltransferase [Fulvivirga lutimaris]